MWILYGTYFVNMNNAQPYCAIAVSIKTKAPNCGFKQEKTVNHAMEWG